MSQCNVIILIFLYVEKSLFFDIYELNFFNRKESIIKVNLNFDKKNGKQRNMISFNYVTIRLYFQCESARKICRLTCIFMKIRLRK